MKTLRIALAGLLLLAACTRAVNSGAPETRHDEGPRGAEAAPPAAPKPATQPNLAELFASDEPPPQSRPSRSPPSRVETWLTARNRPWSELGPVLDRARRAPPAAGPRRLDVGPYVAWLTAPGVVQPAEDGFAPLLQAAGAEKDRPRSNPRIYWQKDGVQVAWAAHLDSELPCPQRLERLGKVLATDGFVQELPGDPSRTTSWMRVEGRAFSAVAITCTEASLDSAITGRFGGRVPRTVELRMALGFPGPPPSTWKAALVQLPGLDQALRRSDLPDFLADRWSSLPFRHAECLAWRGSRCLRLEVALGPVADPVDWIRKSARLDGQHGFACTRCWEDPGGSWGWTTLQTCSHTNLHYHADDKNLRVTLEVVQGAGAQPNVVTCTREARPVAEPKPAPGMEMRLGAMASTAVLAAIDRTLVCYVKHQAKHHRKVTVGDWSRPFGMYLARRVTDTGDVRRSMEVGVQHEQSVPGSLVGLYVRMDSESDDLSVSFHQAIGKGERSHGAGLGLGRRFQPAWLEIDVRTPEALEALGSDATWLAYLEGKLERGEVPGGREPSGPPGKLNPHHAEMLAKAAQFRAQALALFPWHDAPCTFWSGR